MSLFSFWYDMVQDGKLNEAEQKYNKLQARVEELEVNVELFKDWIDFLHTKINMMEKQNDQQQV